MLEYVCIYVPTLGLNTLPGDRYTPFRAWGPPRGHGVDGCSRAAEARRVVQTPGAEVRGTREPHKFSTSSPECPSSLFAPCCPLSIVRPSHEPVSPRSLFTRATPVPGDAGAGRGPLACLNSDSEFSKDLPLLGSSPARRRQHLLHLLCISSIRSAGPSGWPPWPCPSRSRFPESNRSSVTAGRTERETGTCP